MAVIAVLGAGVARANDEIGPGGSAYIDNGGDPTAVATDVSGGGGGRASHDAQPCTWRVLISDDRVVPVYDASGRRLYSTTGRWLNRVCEGDDLLSSLAVGLVPEGGLVDPAALAEQARRSAHIANPAIHTSPDSGRRLYTQVPTWLWLDDSWWQPITVTVTAGRVTTTLTATPTRATWGTGDGESVICDGPGVAWREGMSDDDTYCKHTYVHSSAGRPNGTYPLTVTIEFSVAWTSNVGAGGALGGLTRSTSTEVEVGEIEAIEG